jgi:hypothetical protein
MSTIKFNHNSDSLSDALGINDDQLSMLAETLAEISQDMVQNELELSRVAERLAMTVSYKELLYLATHEIANRTKEALKEHLKRKMSSVLGGIASIDKKGNINIDHMEGMETDDIPDEIKAKLNELFTKLKDSMRKDDDED